MYYENEDDGNEMSEWSGKTFVVRSFMHTFFIVVVVIIIIDTM